MKVTAIMPVFNEVATIQDIVDRVLAVDMDVELLIVDDGSSDGTRDVLDGLDDPRVRVILMDQNVGKGGAIRRAIPEATGDVILIQDADLEYDPQNYPRLVEPIAQEHATVVYGTRFHERNRIGYSRFKIAARMLTVLTNVLFPGAGITDEATCYKVFRTDVLQQIPLRCRRFEFCPEVTMKVLRRGHRIVEVPIDYRPRTVDEGKKINWRDGIEAFWALLRYRWLD